ncbi:MAG: DnaJ family domain-containing protein [Microbacterium sp.]
MTNDSRDAALRYRRRKEAVDQGEDPPEEDDPSASRIWTEAERAAVVDAAIDQAIRRGDFDNLSGAGKPIPGLGTTTDPDWWIRRKIERERLTGLGPPALTLRTEYASLEDRLDELRTAGEVREYLEDFNRRVVEARRQLLGGPPVVTPTVEVDEWEHSWVRRRDAASRRAADSSVSPKRRVPRWRFWRVDR